MVLIRYVGHWGQVPTCPPAPLFELTSKYEPSLLHTGQYFVFYVKKIYTYIFVLFL